jgi:nicotinamide mononucleotide (NMN) deamidase PncC
MRLLLALLFLVSCSTPQPLKVTKGEAIVPLAEFCGGSPSELCSLEYNNYQKARVVRDILYKKKLLLLTAESMSVGNFAGIFGKASWTSGALAGGIVTYATSVKNSELEVTQTNDVGVMSEETALQMAKGLEKKSIAINKWQKKNGKDRLANVYIALTGASTTWKDKKPHVYIAVKQLGRKALVKRIELNHKLKGFAVERDHNIQLAIHHGLLLLESYLK